MRTLNKFVYTTALVTYAGQGHWRKLDQFLDASTHLYKRVCPLVRWSVLQWSVSRFFKLRKSRGNVIESLEDKCDKSDKSLWQFPNFRRIFVWTNLLALILRLKKRETDGRTDGRTDPLMKSCECDKQGRHPAVAKSREFCWILLNLLEFAVFEKRLTNKPTDGPTDWWTPFCN